MLSAALPEVALRSALGCCAAVPRHWAGGAMAGVSPSPPSLARLAPSLARIAVAPFLAPLASRSLRPDFACLSSPVLTRSSLRPFTAHARAAMDFGFTAESDRPPASLPTGAESVPLQLGPAPPPELGFGKRSRPFLFRAAHRTFSYLHTVLLSCA
jgi:hypothetical protein